MHREKSQNNYAARLVGGRRLLCAHGPKYLDCMRVYRFCMPWPCARIAVALIFARCKGRISDAPDAVEACMYTLHDFWP